MSLARPTWLNWCFCRVQCVCVCTVVYELIYFVIEIDLIMPVTLHVVHIYLSNTCTVSKEGYIGCILALYFFIASIDYKYCLFQCGCTVVTYSILLELTCIMEKISDIS